MTFSVETLLIVSLMMAVFAAVSAVGSSLFLGAGFERLRIGFETIKKQTAFFSGQIHNLDQRVDTMEKQNNYYFQAITALEQQAESSSSVPSARSQEEQDQVSCPDPHLIVAKKDDALHVDLLTASGFVTDRAAPNRKETEHSEEHRFCFH